MILCKRFFDIIHGKCTQILTKNIEERTLIKFHHKTIRKQNVKHSKTKTPVGSNSRWRIRLFTKL